MFQCCLCGREVLNPQTTRPHETKHVVHTIFCKLLGGCMQKGVFVCCSETYFNGFELADIRKNYTQYVLDVDGCVVQSALGTHTNMAALPIPLME